MSEPKRRYVKFTVCNGYFQQAESSEPMPLDDEWGIEGDDPIDGATSDQLYDAAKEWMWETNYAPDYTWVECDADGRELPRD